MTSQQTTTMKLLLLVVAAAWVTGARGETLCQLCECFLTTQPIAVDCSTTDLREVPDLSGNNFTVPWRLDFSHNYIKEIPRFPLLPNLVTLSFKGNVVSKIAEAAFRDLPDLRELLLQHNNLTQESLNEDVFKGPFNLTMHEPLPLTRLDLSYNYVAGLDRLAFAHLPAVTTLTLAHNPLRDLSWNTAAAIHELTSLASLDLSQTGLDRLPDHFFSDMKKLRTLILAENQLTSVPIEVNYAHQLEHLNLNGNPIRSLMEGDFQLEGLRVLEVSAMPQLRNVGKRAFSSLPALQRLLLCDNPELTIIDVEAFSNMDGDEMRLEELHLQNNRLMTLREDLVPWLSLRYVDIQNNPWYCDCDVRWVAETLIPDMAAKNPETTLSIVCAEPIADRGIPMQDLVGMTYSFQCQESFHYRSSTSAGLVVGIIVVGALLLITGTLIFTYVLYRKTKDRQLFGESVKYRRAHDQDEDPSILPEPSSLHS